MMSKLIASAVLVAAAFVPSFVLAQTSTTGLLTVYVQTINQTGFSYTPANFTVSVSGSNPSITTFQGSNQGTLVSLSPGDYSVILVNNQYNFSANYSVGCDNTIAAGGAQTCVITVSAGNYFGYPTPYPYPYATTPALTCRTDTPIVGLGQSARFTAIGGAGGTYNWMAGAQNFSNIGPVLTTTFQGSGAQTVTVTNAAQTATCNITVTTSYYPQPQVPSSPVYTQPAYTYPYTQPAYTYPYTQPVATYYPSPTFPNTGFEPVQSAQLAFAFVLLMGAAIAAYPYARKAFALSVR